MAGKKIKELTEAASLNGTDNVIVEDSTPKTKRTTLDKIREWLQGTIEVSSRPIAFTQATTRANVATGDTLATIAGKLAKLFADLSGHAFKATTKDLTTTVEGSALDATMGKKLQDTISALIASIAKNSYADSVNLKSYTNSIYRFPSDGYLCVSIAYNAGNFVYANLYDSSASAFINVQLVSAGVGTNSQTIFVKKGMGFKISQYGTNSLNYYSATFRPLG